MSDLQDLYQEVILDHNKNPRNFREIADAQHANGQNPLCGDKLTLWVKLDADEAVEDIAFLGSGCAISKASASIMTEVLKGKSKKDAEALFQMFHDLVTGQPVQKVEGVDLGKLKALGGVAEFPIRVKCATLAWHTFNAAVDDSEKPVSTE